MSFDPNRHHRRSTRLRGYDYALTGAYFFTVCTWDRFCLFGAIAGDAMVPHAFGLVVAALWERIPARAPHVSLDAFVLMPNHIHGILVLHGDHRARARQAAPDDGPFDPATAALRLAAPPAPTTRRPARSAPWSRPSNPR